jgi:ATP adenylyltransferase
MDHANLWAPWRMPYILGLTDEDANPPTPAASTCFLCDAGAAEAGDDEARQRLILVNDARGIMLLNRYPYTNGHLLIAPRQHVGSLCELTADERAGVIELTALAERLLRTAVNPQGMNMGVNLGRCAGAGLPGHVHVHVVPRWAGDTNYMETIGRVRVIPQALEDSYDHLAATLAKL